MMEYKSIDKGYVIVIKGTKYFLKKQMKLHRGRIYQI